MKTQPVYEAEINPAPVVSMSPKAFAAAADVDLKTLSNEHKCMVIKMLINHMGVAYEKPSYCSRYIRPIFSRAGTSAKRTFIAWTIETRAWRAIKKLYGERCWGSYRF